MTMMEDFNQYAQPMAPQVQPMAQPMAQPASFAPAIQEGFDQWRDPIGAPVVQGTYDSNRWMQPASTPMTKPTINDPDAYLGDYSIYPPQGTDSLVENTTGFSYQGQAGNPGLGNAPLEMINERMADWWSPYGDIIQQDFRFQPQGTPMGTAFRWPGDYRSLRPYYTTVRNQASMMPEPYEWGLEQASATNPFAQEIFANTLAGWVYQMQPIGQENVQGMYGLPAGEFPMMPLSMGGGATFNAPRTFQDQGGNPFATPSYYSSYMNPNNPWAYWNR